jgi:hypothetical protein
MRWTAFPFLSRTGRTLQHPLLLLLAIVYSLLLLQGCGGGGGGKANNPNTPPADSRGTLQVQVTWPDRSRLIPLAANSLKIRVMRNNQLLQEAVLPRPQNSRTFTNLAPGAITVIAEAFPNADGTGVAQATATVNDQIRAEQTTTITLNPASTIASLQISPTNPSLLMGETLNLSVVARNAANEVVLTTPTTVTWFSDNQQIATIDNTGKLTGKAIGQTRITAHEAESNKTVAANVTVRDPSGRLQANVDNSNAPMTVKVLVLNYDPKVPSEGNKFLHEVFPQFIDPRTIAEGYKKDMELASSGQVRFEIVEWRDINAIPAKTDGFIYTPDEYVRLRRLNDPNAWHQPFEMDIPRLLSEQKVPADVTAKRVDEVWLFGDHYFGLLEASMAGPRSFFINGGVYENVPSDRPFAVYGFSYERRTAEMLHNTAHRVEATMNRIYKGWNMNAPTSNWDKFSSDIAEFKGTPGVGTCHFPANGADHYDYANEREVDSTAEDFLNYPNLTGKTTKVSRKNWAGPHGEQLSNGTEAANPDWHRNYLLWYFAHLPRVEGRNPDGKLNNWWRYIYRFDEYDADGNPR